MPSPPVHDATNATMPVAVHLKLRKVLISPDSPVIISIGRMANVFCMYDSNSFIAAKTEGIVMNKPVMCVLHDSVRLRQACIIEMLMMQRRRSRAAHLIVCPRPGRHLDCVHDLLYINHFKQIEYVPD